MHLLPKPRTLRPAAGSFSFRPDDSIAGPRPWAAVVRRLLSPGTGLDLPREEDGRLRLREGDLPTEGYRLRIGPEAIEIEAGDSAGVNWAMQTLRQILPPAALLPGSSVGELSVPAVEIEDAPRFGWRGMHLDVARHFVPLSDLFRFVDLLALHKFNVFHLHLSDDQGWRFESRRYPRLQEVASWRAETRRPTDEVGDGTPHGGFYRQDQLRALVGYAGQRGVEIVPELEFPGHVNALLAAYPELGTNPDRRLATATTFGEFLEVINLSDAAVEVVFGLYTELLDVFPSRYVHVGGDECPVLEWEARPAAVELAERRGLAGPHQLQHWFTRQLRDWLADRGRILVGWDEIASAGPVEDAVVTAWRHSAYGARAAAAGMGVVMTPTRSTYFDYYPSGLQTEPYMIGGLLDTETVYGFDPLEGIPESARHRILGTQGQLWTEYLPTARQVDYAVFPRACALAEVAWSDPTGRSWEEFEPRLAGHLERLDVLGVNYRPPGGPHPWQQGGTGRLRRPAVQADPSPVLDP